MIISNLIHDLFSSRFLVLFLSYILTCAINDFVLSRFDRYPFLNIQYINYPRYIKTPYRYGL